MTSGTSLPLRTRPPSSLDADSLAVVGGAVTVIDRSPASAGSLHGLRGSLVGGLAEVGPLGHEERLVGNVGCEAGLAQDRAVALRLQPERQVLAAALDDAAHREDVDE